MPTENTDNPFGNAPRQQPHANRPSRSNALWWILGSGAFLVLLFCGGICAGILYMGAAGPETSVYVGNQVPERFLATAREVGALDDGENVRYFYSDAMVDIRKGFYFVSDKKVVLYIEDGRTSPLQTVPFDEIASAEFAREESFITDSQITLQTTDGEFIAFPVSSEFDRDEAFFKAIQERIR